VLSEARGPTDIPLLEETIGENLARSTAAVPDRDFLIVRHQQRRYTYSEFAAEVDALARGLLRAGLEVGDRVGIWSPNNAEWVCLQYATAKIGAILVNINPAYRAAEAEYALQQSGCRMLVSAQRFKSSDYRAMLDEVRGNLPGLDRVVFLDSPDWSELLDGAAQVPPAVLAERAAKLHPDDPINIQYTSGTTGFPKGATLSHRNILNNGYLIGQRVGYSPDDRICVPVPFYHCFGMVIGNLAASSHGAAIVVPGEAFEARSVLEAVEAERCTSLYGVPTMFIAELEHPDFETFDLGSLRTGVMAGSPCPVEVMKQCIDRMNMRDVTIAYGMTELSPVVTQTERSDDLERRTSTVGRTHPHVELKIVSPETNEVVPIGAAGELCARGYSVMKGYWNDPERTAEVIDAEGFMHTGDLAVMNEAGYVNIVGRIKDLIIRAGENVYPREIEEFLYQHPDVTDVQVIGVPDEKYGEEIVAWVQRREGSELTEEEVVAFCKGRIAHFKVPRYVRFVSEFPMTITGKIQKFKLREMAMEAFGLHEVRTA